LDLHGNSYLFSISFGRRPSGGFQTHQVGDDAPGEAVSGANRDMRAAPDLSSSPLQRRGERRHCGTDATDEHRQTEHVGLGHVLHLLTICVAR
jgi:hypothetical protein